MIELKYASDIADLDCPEDLELLVKFSSDCSIDQAVTAFKMFLTAMGYCPKKVDCIEYNPEE